LVVELARTATPGSHTIALSGGVFQNALLLRLVSSALRERNFEVITHRVVPPNDGGIALGQLLVGNSV
jgi:hydrogenase maturation protein HypF